MLIFLKFIYNAPNTNCVINCLLYKLYSIEICKFNTLTGPSYSQIYIYEYMSRFVWDTVAFTTIQSLKRSLDYVRGIGNKTGFVTL